MTPAEKPSDYPTVEAFHAAHTLRFDGRCRICFPPKRARAALGEARPAQ